MNKQQTLNRCKKVFTMGALRLCRGLDFLKIDKNPLIYSVSCFNLGTWCFVYGTQPTKAPRDDGTM